MKYTTMSAILRLLLFVAPLSAKDFYVDPNGNDANPGTQSSPFATLLHARDAVRTAKKNGDLGPFTVQLAGGHYILTDTLSFSPEDSGTKDAPVVWRSAPNEHAVLSGGQIISGFRENTLNGVRRWTVELPKVKSGAEYFRQLFISTNGQPYERRFRPMIGMKRVDGLTDSPKRINPHAHHREAQKDFYFAPGDFKQWENPGDIEVVILHVWSSSRMMVQNVDTENNIVTFTAMPTFAVNQDGLQPYFIENVKEELKSPGEWYLDRPTGLLTYLPEDGEILANTRVVVPRLVKVMTLIGDYPKDSFVENITFENLVFSHNESPLPREGYSGPQGNPDVPAAIELTGAKNCKFLRCTVSQTGNYGISLGLGSQSNSIVGCRLFDLGAGGIKIGDIHMKEDAKYPELPTGNRVENCAISDGGIMYFSGNAVWAGIVRDTVINHNLIWNFPYSGIAIGWAWHSNPTSCGSNHIEYNYISNVLTLIADGASIYTLGRQPGTVIRGNVTRDNLKSPFAKHYWQLGLYLDEGSSEMLVENNFVYHVGTSAFNMNGGAKNIIRNNILGPVYDFEGTKEVYIRCHKRPYAHSNIFTHNLMYFDSVNMVEKDMDKSLFDCSENLYWNFAGKPFYFCGKTFTDWQAGGEDAGSINVDPLFEDPAHGDFRLKKSSPAFSLGFKEFDIAAAGLEPAFKDVATHSNSIMAPFYAMKLPGSRPFTGFDLKLNHVPVGALPHGFTLSGGTPEANFRVDDGIGKNGGHALVATTKKNGLKSYYPYLTYQFPKQLDHGILILSFDIKQKADAPAIIDVSFRDYSKRGNLKKEYISSPNVMFTADGEIKSGNNIITTAAPGSWTHIQISFPLTGTVREASIAVTQADATKKEFKCPVDSNFTAVTALGFFCNDALNGVCYIDNLHLEAKDQEVH